MKKLKTILVMLLFAVMVPFVVNAEEAGTKTEIKVYMFRGEGCGFCEKALTFFESIENDYGKYFELVTYEVWNDTTNQKLMQDVGKYLNKSVKGIPLIIIGEKTYSGFDEKYADSIKADIVAEYNKTENDRVDVIKDMNENKGKGLNPDIVISVVTVVIVVAIGVFIYTARRNVEATYMPEPQKVEEEVETVEIKKEEKTKKVIKEENINTKKASKKTVDTKEKKKNSTSSKNKTKK